MSQVVEPQVVEMGREGSPDRWAEVPAPTTRATVRVAFGS